MLFLNKTQRTKEVSPGHGSAPGILLGESVPGGREIFIRTPRSLKGLYAGVTYEKVTIEENGIGRPRISDSEDKALYAILTSVSDDGPIANDGRILAPVDQNVRLMARAIDVKVDSRGCITETSDTLVLQVAEGDSYRVDWDNGSTAYYKVTKYEVTEVERPPFISESTSTDSVWRPV